MTTTYHEPSNTSRSNSKMVPIRTRMQLGYYVSHRGAFQEKGIDAALIFLQAITTSAGDAALEPTKVNMNCTYPEAQTGTDATAVPDVVNNSARSIDSLYVTGSWTFKGSTAASARLTHQ